MENPGNRRSRLWAGTCCAVTLLTVACGSYAAPVWVLDGITTLIGDAGGEQLVGPASGGARCPDAREGCAAPVDLAPDLYATQANWTSLRVTHTSADLWPTQTVATPDSPQELISFLVWRGVKDIRLADPQFVFSLGAPQMELASAGVMRDESRTTVGPSNVTASSLDDKENPRGIPEGSSLRLREMIESLTDNHTAHVLTAGKPDTPLTLVADTARLYLDLADPTRDTTDPGATPHKAADARYRDPNDWTINVVKSFSEKVTSILRAIREMFS